MKRKIAYSLIIGMGVLTVISSCEEMVPPALESENILAEPLKELSPAQMALHLEGDEQFAKIYTPAEGLGPVFVQQGCESCHVGDGKGHPENKVTRFGQWSYGADTVWSSMLERGGPQLQHRTIMGYKSEILPNGSHSADFIAMNVTGLGYLAAVEDQYIIDMAANQDTEGKVSGVVNYIEPPEYFNPTTNHVSSNGKYIGRFGRKANSIDLMQRVVEAFKEDIGITSDFDMEDPINFSLSAVAGDNVPDPEIPTSTINSVVFYLQTLEAPRRRDSANAEVLEGEGIFKNIGCENCHRETLVTGPSELSALNEVEFHPYTDMLLHDMGSDLDDEYTEGSVSTSEWRTPPLWGMGLENESQGSSMYLLHDGRATSFDQAIRLHGGEAAFARSNYDLLSDKRKELLFKFLNSL